MAYMTPVMAQAPGTAANEDTYSLAAQLASALFTNASAYEEPFVSPPSDDIVILSESYIVPPAVVAIPPRKLNLDIPYSRETFCSCVLYAKAVLGVTGTWGNAKDIQPTTQIPKVGSVIITTEGGGHVGVVTAVASASVEIADANFYSCASSSRTLPLDYPLTRGYKDY